LLASLLLALVPFASALQDEDLGTLLGRVLTAGRSADPREIEAIGARQSEEALDGLREIAVTIDGTKQKRAAFRALRHFRGTALESDAIALLVERIFDKDEEEPRLAADGLLRFGAAARAANRRVVTKSKDALCRAIALAGLLEDIERDPEPEALGWLLEDTVLGVTCWKPDLARLLALFGSDADLTRLRRAIGDRDVSPFHRAVVVEVLLARPQEAPLPVLKAGLRAKSATVSWVALKYLIDHPELDASVLSSDLKKLGRSFEPSLRRGVAIVRGRVLARNLDPERRQAELDKLLRSKAPTDRQAAAALLAEDSTTAPAEIATRLHALLVDPDRTVAAEALIAIERLRRVESIPVLIDALGVSTGQPLQDLRAVLVELTGEDHGLSASRWQAWWEAVGADFEVPAPEEVEALRARLLELQAAHESRATFYGLPVVSDRVAFLLDVSGSMSTEVRPEETRLGIAIDQLEAVLARLSDGALVNVVFFSDDARAWSDVPLALDAERRTGLAQFLHQQFAWGRTNLYTGLERALADPRIDTLYVLSDGKPEGGPTEDPESIVAEVTRWNSARHVVIHSVAVGEELWLMSELARRTEGRSLVAD